MADRLDILRSGAQGALAVVVDDPQRQPHPRERRRAEGRRPPGLLRLARHDHDGALLRRAPAETGSRWPMSPAFHAIRTSSAGRARKMEAFAYKGPDYPSRTKFRRRRLLHRLGRPRRQTLFASLVRTMSAPRRRRRTVGEAAWSPSSATPRWTRQRSGPPRGLEAGRPQHLVDRRLQPPEPRRGGARACGRASRRCSARSAGVVILKYGSLLEAAFASPAATCSAAGSIPRTSSIPPLPSRAARHGKRLLDEIGDQGAVSALIGSAPTPSSPPS